VRLLLPLSLAAALLAPRPAAAEETVQSDDWFAVYVNDTKAGHARTRVLRVDDPTSRDSRPSFVTETTSEFHIARAGAEMPLSSAESTSSCRP